ncbi:hypothetical protein FPV67DRAFT_71058 [Lyophyllum atratum]|nr:hypothetical protein FPV67DRAFT_71058 [Lyophyllum atratum]
MYIANSDLVASPLIVMALIAAFCLYALHYIYSLAVQWHSFWKRYTWTPPQSLEAPRRRIPQHLAIVLVTHSTGDVFEAESCIVQSVINAAGWCRAAGIEKLTVYEEHGKLLKCSQNIRDSLGDDADESSSDSEIDYPPTPPPSDYSESRPISPQRETHLDMHTMTIHVSKKQRKREFPKGGLINRKDYVTHTIHKELTLCLASRESSKPTIASLATLIASQDKRKSRRNAKHPKFDAFTLTVDALDSVLESNHTLSSPDFMIIHPINPRHYNRTPVELHGYPPWHIRLTEIYHNRYQSPSMTSLPFDETTFNQALDEFAAAEMRFGK